MKAYLKNYRQSPRKVRLLSDLVRGMRADKALVTLAHTPKRAAVQVEKLIKSAVANSGKDAKELTIAEISIDEGRTLRRLRPASRGRGTVINKRTSHIKVALADAPDEKKPATSTKKASAKS